jgi:hypothetical protein
VYQFIQRHLIASSISILFQSTVLLLSGYTSLKAQHVFETYVYHQGKDTLHIKPISDVRFELTDTPIEAKPVDSKGFSVIDDYSFGKSSIEVMDSVQIDGKGAKELFLIHTLTSNFPMHGGTFDGSDFKTNEQLELWNLDTKEMYWCGIVFYEHSSVGSYNSNRRDVFQFQYHLDPDGTLTIQKEYAQSMHTDSIAYGGKSRCVAIVPELKEGIYQWKEGGFQRVN